MNNRAINDFMEVTGTSKPTATKYLKQYEYNFNQALDQYLGKRTVNKQLLTLFEKYRQLDNQNQTIGIEGTLAYLADLGIEPEDIRSLVLSHFLQCDSMGIINKDPFVQNWDLVRIYDVGGMTKYITDLTATMLEVEHFDGLYLFTFGFLLEHPNQKLISGEILVEYWQLMFELIPAIRENNDVKTRINQLYQYILDQEKKIPKDTYLMIWEFIKEVVVKDPVTMSAYDDMSSWPVLIDEFIEDLQEKGLLQQE